VPYDDVAAAEARYTGAACSIASENLSGRADPAECGPFPCAYGKCVVDKCPADGVCSMGICADGYCVRSNPAGAKACSPLDGAANAEAIAMRDGCTCSPQSMATPRDREICGSFPCSPNGCYVARCKSDGDCKLGICSPTRRHRTATVSPTIPTERA
jgi:hypothetical protein